MIREASLMIILAASTIGCDMLSKKDQSGETEERSDDSAAKKKGKKAKAKKKAEPMDFEWSSETEFKVKGSAKRKGRVSIHEGNYQVTLYDFPKGTEWSAGDKKGTVEGFTLAILKLMEVKDKFGSLSIDNSKQEKIDPELTLKLELPDGEHGELKLPPTSVGYALEEALKKVENGPVLFGEEPPDEKPQENVLFLYGAQWKVFGAATKMQDIDTIAVPHLLGEVKSTKTCSGYTNNAGTKMPDLELRLKETEVNIFERRTGKVVEKKTFPPYDKCPMFTFRSKDENGQDSSIPANDIETWLRTQVKR